MRLTTIQRKAAIAWCPIPEYSNYLAAGSLAGSLEADFSAQSKVELYNVVNFANKSKEAEPLGFSLSTDRFTQLCWGNPAQQEYPMGVIAGAMMDGTIELHNPEVVLKHEQTEEVKPLASFEKHTKAVRGLEFNPKSTNLLASAGEDSQLYIFNLKNPTTPTLYTLGGKNPHQGQVISALGWNRIFEYILATTSQQGVSVIWDLKQKKPLVGFSNQSRLRRYSSIAWSPSDATQLAVAADDDDAAVIELWDVRQTHAPVKTLQGHNKGILSLSWCPDDSNLLLSSGKDGRTIIWNPHTGEILGELASSVTWMYDVKWSNRPSVLSTSSYDGRINVYSLQDSSAEADAETEEPNALGIKTKPAQTSNKSVFKTAPRWLQRPVGASFGFGKLVSFNQQSKSVTISNVVTEPEFATRSEELENVLKTGAFEEYCDKKAAAASTENDRAIWNTMKVLFKQGAEKQDKILQALGFDKSQISGSLEEQFNNATQEGDAEEEERPKINQQKVDELIRSSITVANFEDAVNICLKAGRMDDALVIAAWGGPQLWEKTRQEYLNKQKRPAMKVIAKILTNKLEDIIAEADLANWKETLAVLATFAKEHFTPLCQKLGDRLESESKDLPAATICHMLSGNIEKVVAFWLEDLKAKDATDNDALVSFMEKVVVFQQSKPSQQPLSVELVEKYTDYAVLLSSQGLLSAALRYLNLTLTASGSLPKATAELRHRIFNALEKPFGPVPQQPWAQARISAAPRPEQPKQPVRPAPTAPWTQPGTFPVPQPVPSRPAPVPTMTMPSAPGVMPPGMPAPSVPAFTPQPIQPSMPTFVPSPVPQPGKVGTPGLYEPPAPSFGLPPVAPAPATNPIGLPPAPFNPVPAPAPTGAFQPIGLPPSGEPAQPMIPAETTTKRPEPTPAPAPAPRREEPKKAAAAEVNIDTSKLEGDAQTIANVLQAAFDKAFGGNLGSTEQTKKKLTRKDLNVLLTQLNENKVPEALLKLVLEFALNLEKRDFVAADKDLKKMSSGFLEESKSYFKGLKFLQQTLKG